MIEQMVEQMVELNLNKWSNGQYTRAAADHKDNVGLLELIIIFLLFV